MKQHLKLLLAGLCILSGVMPEVLSGPVPTALDCLLVFADTTDWTYPADKKAAVENVLFNNTQNVSDATLASTFGNYSYRHGSGGASPGTITITLSTTAAGMAGDMNPDSGVDRQAFLDAVQGMGYDVNAYHRVLLFAPDGYPSGDNFAQASIPGRYSVFGYGSHGNRLFYYLMHELGHNFPLHHSGVGANEYGDTSCAMAVYWDGLDRSPCFNASTVIEGGFLDGHTGAVSLLSVDTTLDLYPMGVDPGTTAGVRVVQIGGQQLFVSYMRNILPYAYLADSSHHDKVMVHEQWTYDRPHSDLKRVLGVGESYVWNGVSITFNAYGTGNGFANVTVDLPEKGDAPTANPQTLSMSINASLAVTLSGSDPEGDPLYYNIESAPANGSLSGTYPNLTYTPSEGFVGTDAFTFSVSDLVTVDEAQVSIDVLDTRSTVRVYAVNPSTSENSAGYVRWIVERIGGDMTGALAVDYEIVGTATHEDDFTLQSGVSLSGKRYINVGASSSTMYAFPIDDALAEGMEMISFRVLESENTYHISATEYSVDLKILDDESASTFSVTYLANGGSGSLPTDSADYNLNDTVTVAAVGDLSRSGYAFSGWDTQSTGAGTRYNEGETFSITENVPLFAIWTPVTTFTLSYFADAGGSIGGDSSQTVIEGDDGAAVIAIPDTGYTFSQWDDGNTNASRIATNVQADVTVTAWFSPISYSVIFDIGTNGVHTGGGSLTQQVNHESAATAPVITPDSEWIFAGWDTPFSSVTGSVTITAQYVPYVEYTLTYLAGTNGSISGTATQTVVAGSDGMAVTAIPDADHEFMNWSDGLTVNPRLDTAVTNDLTVTANFAFDPATVVNQGASALTETSASLSGELTGGTSADAWICWGASDGGMGNTGAWEHVVSIGSVAEGGAFSTNITGLATNTTYFYRCYASSPSSEDWSDVATSFSGTSVGGGGAAVEAVLSVAEVFCHNEKDNFTGNPGDMISGSGMNGNANDYSGPWPTNEPSLWTATDSGYRSEWQSQGLLSTGTSANAKIGWTVFDLGDMYTLEDFYIWNVRENSGRYTATFNVYVAATPTVLPIHGPTDSTSIDYDFSSGGWTQVNGSVLTGSWKGSQVVNIGGLSGRYVAVEILSNNGDGSRVGLAEVGVVASALQGAPVGNLAPAGITAGNATLNAALDAGSTDYAVYVHWGVSNGGSNAASWTSSAYVGSWTNVSTNVAYVVGGLAAGQAYYCTFHVSNAVTNVWAAPSWMFSTLPAVSGGSVTTNYGVPHSWLTAVNPAWTNDFEAAVTNDWDGDGYFTWQEYLCGTDPTKSASFLRIDSVSVSGGNIQIEWEHSAIGAYVPSVIIRATTNIMTGPWYDAGTNVAVNGTNTWSSDGEQWLYYKLLVTGGQ